jgi:hypothetical protein
MLSHAHSGDSRHKKLLVWARLTYREVYMNVYGFCLYVHVYISTLSIVCITCADAPLQHHGCQCCNPSAGLQLGLPHDALPSNRLEGQQQLELQWRASVDLMVVFLWFAYCLFDYAPVKHAHVTSEMLVP